MGHDGLPFTGITSGDKYYFRHDVSRNEPFDFFHFYEVCLPAICRDDKVAGECRIHSDNGVFWVGVDLYTYDQTDDMINAKLIKLEA